MAWRIMTVANRVSSQAFTALAEPSNTYVDPLSAFVMSMPQSKQTETGDDGFVTSATVDLAGGVVPPNSGIWTGGWGFADARAALTVGGFRPGAKVDITGYGPSGGQTVEAAADGNGTVTGGGGLLRYTDADIQPGQFAPGGKIVVAEDRGVRAYIAPFPHPLYNEPLYIGYGIDQIQYRRFKPIGRLTREITYESFRPGYYKGYSETVNIGHGIEDHPTTDALSGQPCPGRFLLYFNINFKKRRARRESGNAVVIWPGDYPEVSVQIKNAGSRSIRSGQKNPGAYVIESSSGKLVSTGDLQYNSRTFRVRDGESLIIASATFGSRPTAYPAYYTPASNPQADLTLNADENRKGFFDITTRPFLRRDLPRGGWGQFLAAHEPGIAQLEVWVD